MPYFSSSLFMLLISSSAGGDRAEGTDQRRKTEEWAGFERAGDVECSCSWLLFDNQIIVWLQDREPSCRQRSQEELLMTFTFTKAAGKKNKKLLCSFLSTQTNSNNLYFPLPFAKWRHLDLKWNEQRGKQTPACVWPYRWNPLFHTGPESAVPGRAWKGTGYVWRRQPSREKDTWEGFTQEQNKPPGKCSHFLTHILNIRPKTGEDKTVNEFKRCRKEQQPAPVKEVKETDASTPRQAESVLC